jgi:hypothetical protein
MNDKKKLESVMVRTGMTDGTFTEIVRGKIEEGKEIVVGTIASKSASATAGSFTVQSTATAAGRRNAEKVLTWDSSTHSISRSIR